jgi:hypothetical protein
MDILVQGNMSSVTDLLDTQRMRSEVVSLVRIEVDSDYNLYHNAQWLYALTEHFKCHVFTIARNNTRKPDKKDVIY